jgi:hypothetical protein
MPATRYNVLYDDKGTRRLVEVDLAAGLVRAVADDAAHAKILEYTTTLGRLHRDFECASASDIEHVRRFIVAMAPGISQDVILPIAWKSQPGLAYERLPFNLDSAEDAPTWESILSRCSNALAIKAFLGSLFDPEADRSQFLYIYGAGNEGKGSMIEALSTVLGSAHTNQITPKELRFWLSSIYNKRLVTFSECDDFKFAVSEDMKAVTGNDTVSVDEKGQPIFKAKAICKFMFAANVKPRAQDTPAHRRRLIYSEVSPYTGKPVPYKAFVGSLVTEMHAFLSLCWREYQRLCPGGEIIPVEKEAFDLLLKETQSDFEEILQEFFVVDPRLVCRSRDVANVLTAIAKVPPQTIPAFKQFLKSKGVKYSARYVVPTHPITGEEGESEVAVRHVNGLVGIAPKPIHQSVPQYRTESTSREEWAAFCKRHDFNKAWF